MSYESYEKLSITSSSSQRLLYADYLLARNLINVLKILRNSLIYRVKKRGERRSNNYKIVYNFYTFLEK